MYSSPKKAQVTARLFFFWSSHIPPTQLIVRFYRSVPCFGPLISFMSLTHRKPKDWPTSFCPAMYCHPQGPPLRRSCSICNLHHRNFRKMRTKSRLNRTHRAPLALNKMINNCLLRYGIIPKLNLVDTSARLGDRAIGHRKKTTNKSKSKVREETYGSTDNSSDDDPEEFPEPDLASDPGADGNNAFSCLSANIRQVFRQGGPRFADFLCTLKLEVTTKIELYQVLEYYRTGMQCIRTFCSQNKFPLSHKKCKEQCQVVQLPIFLPELRSHRQTTFLLAERVVPTEILRLL